MKTVFLFACLALMPVLTRAQSKALDTFQRKYKGAEESFSLNVSGGVLRLLMWFDGNEEDRELKEFAKEVKHVKIFRVPQRKHGLSLADFNHLKEEVRKEAFDELMTVRSDDGNVDILIKEKNDLISDILLLINDQDDFVVLSLRGKMDLNKVFKMCNNIHIKGI